MASEGTNHLVTLFLISNSFCGFGFGVFLFAVLGVGNAVITGTTSAGYIRCIWSGFSITFLSMVGCFGAITQNKKKLSGYVSVMIIVSILEIVHLVKSDLGEQHNQTEICVSMIFIIVFTLVTILLGLTITCRIVYGEIDEKERQQQGLGAA